METAHRGTAAQAMGQIKGYAGGGLIEGFKRAVGITPESPELKAYKERSAAERAGKAAKPAAQTLAEPPKSAIGDYAGNTALDKRMAAAGLAKGGPVTGPGTGTSDSVPIMASAGEFVVRAAAVEEIGVEALEAINRLGEDNAQGDEPEHKVPGKFKVGGYIDQIPTGGTGQGPTPQPDPSQSASGSELGRNVTNTLSALPGASPALGAVSRLATASPAVNSIVSGLGTGAGAVAGAGVMGAKALAPIVQPALPYAAPAGGAALLSMASGPGGTSSAARMAAPSTTGNLAFPTSKAGAGRGMVNPDNVAPAPDMSFITPAAGSAPATPASNLFWDGASWNSNRKPMSAQDQMAMDGIQARQDMRDSNAQTRAQYDSEVASAQATNNYTANRGKSVTRMAAEGKLAQDVRGDATARYQSDNSLKGAELSAGASRYSTDAQRENNQGQLGVAQGRLANETSTTELDNAAKSQMQVAQNALAKAKTPEEVESATQILRALQGKYGKDQTTHWKGIAGGTDAMGNKTDPFLYNEATGETKRASGEQPGGKPQVTRAQVDAAAKAKGISDPAQLKKMYAVYGV